MKKTKSFLLSFLLIFPSLFSFAHHLFEDHEVCNETKVHFHQAENHCSVCYVIANAENSFTTDKKINYLALSNDDFYIDLIRNPISKFKRTFNLRAPPKV